MTPAATLSSPEKCRAGHRINAPQCSTGSLRDCCWLHLRIKGIKPVMSVPCCCNFWVLIPSNLDSSSDFCPTPWTRGAQKPQCSTQLLCCIRLSMKGWRKPQNSPPNYSSWWRQAMSPPWPFSSAPLDLYTAPPFSVNRFSTTKFKNKTKHSKPLFKMLPEEWFLHQNTSFLQLSPRLQRVSKGPPGKADIVARQYHWHRCPCKWGLHIKARSSVWVFKNSIVGMALKPNKHTVKKLSRLRTRT